MHIQVKLHHCAFYQYNHCYINRYLDADSAPTIVPTIKGLKPGCGFAGKDLRQNRWYRSMHKHIPELFHVSAVDK